MVSFSIGYIDTTSTIHDYECIQGVSTYTTTYIPKCRIHFSIASVLNIAVKVKTTFSNRRSNFEFLKKIDKVAMLTWVWDLRGLWKASPTRKVVWDGHVIQTLFIMDLNTSNGNVVCNVVMWMGRQSKSIVQLLLMTTTKKFSSSQNCNFRLIRARLNEFICHL